jgi:hypothetical protein
MGSGSAVGLLVAVCIVAVVAGVLMAASQPPRRATPRDLVSCTGSCWNCANGNVAGCFECGSCARFLPR